SRPLGAADHGAQVSWIADLVEASKERRLTGGELERVGVAKRLTPREDALVVARARGLRQVTLELRLHARPFDVRQPRLAPDRAPPQLVVAPAVHHRQRLRRVEVVVECSLEICPAPDRLARRAKDVAERLELSSGLLERPLIEIERLAPLP